MNKKEKKRRESIITALKDMAHDEGCMITLIGKPGKEFEYAEAVVGTIESHMGFRVAYSSEKVIKELMRIEKWSEEDAEEWFEFNTVRGAQYMSERENPPVFVREIVA